MLFGIPYAEWIGYVAVVVLVILFGLPNGWLKRLEKYYSSDHLHQPLSAQDVSVITICDKEVGEKELGAEEAQQIIALFNGAKLVQKVEPPHNAVHITIRIAQKDGGMIEVMPYRNDVLIVREEKDKNEIPITYWAKQDGFAKWLYKSEER